MYRFARIILLPIYTLFVKTKIEGEHFVPSSGAAILVSNHISFIDPFALGYLARRRKRQVHFLAKHEIFKIPVVGWFLRKCGQIPVERGTERAQDSLKFAFAALEDHRVVGIYPEATMPTDLIQLPIKSGAIRLAAQSGAPLIVVGTWGAQDLWRKGKLPKPRLRKVHWIVVTPPFYVEKGADIEQAREELSSRMIKATTLAKRKIGE